MRVKAVFFDIDGTLVSLNSHRMPESTHRALARLREKGIKVLISSGRHRTIMENLDGETFDGYVTVNGSLCYYQDKVVHKCSIPENDLRNWVEFLKTHNTNCFVVTEESIFLNHSSESASKFLKLLNFESPEVRKFAHIAPKPVYQIIGLIEKGRDSEAVAALPNCSFNRWHPSFVDIIRKGSDKSKGMEVILDIMGISGQECVAFGDGGNDLEMLRFAGIGVAMGNSELSVIEAANYVTDTVDNGGIWNALVKLNII